MRTVLPRGSLRPFWIWTLALVLAVGSECKLVLAQDVERPSERLPELPDFLPRASDGLKMPEAPGGVGEALPDVPKGPTLVAKDFRFVGNTAIASEELGRLAAPFLGRPLGSEDIEALRVILTRAYVDRGYINSGVLIPDQTIEDGVVTLQIVEGVLSDIRLRGAGGLDEGYLRERLALGAGPPLNVNELQERFQILLQDPLIRRLNGALGVGQRPGEAVLDVAVERNEPYSLGLTIANDEPPAVGAIGGKANATFRNLTGWGDALMFDFTRTEGLSGFTISGSIPISADDTRLYAEGGYRKSQVVEEPINEIDVESKSWNLALGIRHPVYRTPATEVAFDFSFSRRHSQTFLLGQPFSFSQGAINGNTDVGVLRFAQDFTDRQIDQVVALRSTLNFGSTALGGTEFEGEPDGTYFFWLGQAQYARRFQVDEALPAIQMLVRGNIQLASDVLPSLEQFANGGVSSVRGYRENQFVDDHGVNASLELRVPVAEVNFDLGGLRAHRSEIILAPFIDWGATWAHDQKPKDGDDIAGAGLGLRWQPLPWLQLSCYYAESLIDLPRGATPTTDDLQDVSVYFSVEISYP